MPFLPLKPTSPLRSESGCTPVPGRFAVAAVAADQPKRGDGSACRGRRERMRRVFVCEIIAAVRNANAEERVASAMSTSPFSHPRICPISMADGCAADGVLDGTGGWSTRHRFRSPRRRGLRHRVQTDSRSMWRHNVFESNAVSYESAVCYMRMPRKFSES